MMSHEMKEEEKWRVSPVHGKTDMREELSRIGK